MEVESVVAISTGVAGGLAGIGGLVISIVNSVRVIAIEKLKNELELDLERHKAKLAAENQQSYFYLEKLFDSRAQAIQLFYSNLVIAVRDLQSMTSILEYSAGPSKKERAETFFNSFNALNNLYQEKRLFFDEVQCQVIDSILNKMWEAYVEFTVHVIDKDENTDNYGLKWKDAWKTATSDVPKLKRSLEEDFRSLLSGQLPLGLIS